MISPTSAQKEGLLYQCEKRSKSRGRFMISTERGGVVLVREESTSRDRLMIAGLDPLWGCEGMCTKLVMVQRATRYPYHPIALTERP